MDITSIVVAVVGLVAAVALTFLVRLLKENLNAEQLESLQVWTRIFVQAAEQLAKSSKFDKFAWVRESLEKVGLSCDEGAVNAAIESAVLEMNSALYGESGKDGGKSGKPDKED